MKDQRNARNWILEGMEAKKMFKGFLKSKARLGGEPVQRTH